MRRPRVDCALRNGRDRLLRLRGGAALAALLAGRGTLVVAAHDAGLVAALEAGRPQASAAGCERQGERQPRFVQRAHAAGGGKRRVDAPGLPASQRTCSRGTREHWVSCALRRRGTVGGGEEEEDAARTFLVRQVWQLAPLGSGSRCEMWRPLVLLLRGSLCPSVPVELMARRGGEEGGEGREADLSAEAGSSRAREAEAEAVLKESCGVFCCASRVHARARRRASGRAQSSSATCSRKGQAERAVSGRLEGERALERSPSPPCPSARRTGHPSGRELSFLARAGASRATGTR